MHLIFDILPKWIIFNIWEVEMGRYKKSRKSEYSVPFIPLGDRIHTTKIKDKKTGKTGKGIGWTKGKADDKAWKDLNKKKR